MTQKIVIINFYNRIKALNLARKKVNSEKINNEIDSLKRLNNTYILNKNVLKINVIENARDLKLLNLKNFNQGSYIKIGKKFYKINESDNFKPLLVEKDSALIKQLDKIIITNPD
jgi:hypothetical protein